MDNLPVITNQEIESTVKEGGSIALATLYRNKILSIPTPKDVIQYKDKFPYTPSKYVCNLFDTIFPISEQDMLSRTEDIYNINYTIKITVVLIDGTRISKIGCGGSRKQVKTSAKQAFERDGKPITPFDYVDISNNDKAALTLAIKNCQERFYICADVTDRIVLTTEQLKELNDLITVIIDKYVVNPRDKINYNTKRDNLKTTKDKFEFLQFLREQLPECEELFNEER